jgi:hypothetical protein
MTKRMTGGMAIEVEVEVTPGMIGKLDFANRCNSDSPCHFDRREKSQKSEIACQSVLRLSGQEITPHAAK